MHIFKPRTGSVDLRAKSLHWTYFSRQRLWQFTPCANACQKRPKPKEIRIAPVIFLFIDFFSFGKALEPRFRHKHESRLQSSGETVNFVSNTGSKLLVWQRQIDENLKGVPQRLQFLSSKAAIRQFEISFGVLDECVDQPLGQYSALNPLWTFRLPRGVSTTK